MNIYCTYVCVQRMEFSWSDKSKDFERYERPALDFGVKQPVTIHLAGESRKNELDQYTSLEETKWRETLVVDDTRSVAYCMELLMI